MKTDIRKVKYGPKNANADWWTWTETCDTCGTIIHKACKNLVVHLKNGEYVSSSEPDTTNKDWCYDCLQKRD